MLSRIQMLERGRSLLRLGLRYNQSYKLITLKFEANGAISRKHCRVAQYQDIDSTVYDRYAFGQTERLYANFY